MVVLTHSTIFTLPSVDLRIRGDESLAGFESDHAVIHFSQLTTCEPVAYFFARQFAQGVVGAPAGRSCVGLPDPPWKLAVRGGNVIR
jgi:hypothetical protein